MQFKGTKGKWVWNKGHWHDNVSTNNGEIIICAIRQPSLSLNEHDANARLISYAPEMLEMLIKLRGELTAHTPEKIHDELEQLIKEATTL